MTTESEAAALAAADTEASTDLVREADPWIDLTRAGTESEVLMAHLAERYAEVNEAYLATIGSDPAALLGAVRLLARQLARAQADIFALKSAVLGRDRMVLTQDWDYRDPLATHARSFASDGTKTLWTQTGRYTLPLDEALLGFGWYPPEGNERSVWRWSGPGVKATILVPRFYAGRLAVEVTFNTVRRGVMPEAGGLIVDEREIAYDLSFANDETTQGKLSFTLDLEPMAEGATDKSFLPLEFRIARTYSPAKEFGKSDKRELGICILKIEISTGDSAKGAVLVKAVSTDPIATAKPD
ncbi:MAG: hypothetical protein ACK4GT_09910 [Pararhodobacter sp.]